MLGSAVAHIPTDNRPTENRRAPRRSRPGLTVRFGMTFFKVKDWSIKGFAVHGLDQVQADLSPGDKIGGYYGMGDDNIVFKFLASVTRVDEAENVIAFDFVDLMPESRALLVNILRTRHELAI